MSRLVTISVDAPGEEGTIVDAYMTDDVDTWGKRTFHVVRGDGNLEAWYLFRHEYTVLETHEAES